MSTPPAFDPVALASLQNELGRFVIEEFAAQRSDVRKRWAQPVADRVEEGRCIDALRVVAFQEPDTWVLQGPGNDSRFREGDFVRLSLGDAQLPFMEGFVRAIDDHRVEVMRWRNHGTETRCAIGLAGVCVDESFFDLEDRYRAAIEDLGRTEIGRDLILPLLNQQRRPAIDAALFDETHEAATAGGLNDRQAEAVAHAVATDLCWLVQGPPGTGKTHVLAWIIADLLRRGERVLVTSFTHRAINNLLAAVATRLPDARNLGKVALFTDPALPANVQQASGRAEFNFLKQNAAAPCVIGATPFALRSSRLAGMDFDTVIIDEASQVTLPLAVMAMLAGRRYIFAGDHQQLPPVATSVTPAEARHWSVFGRLVGRGQDTLLDTTHRLNDALCRWPSDTFYHSLLRSHPRAAGRRLQLSAPPAPDWRPILAPDPAAVWLAVPHTGNRSHSSEEILVTAGLLRALHAGGLDWSRIGVVVPFRRQARNLRRRLASLQPDRHAPAELVVDTVERMQGQEREVVIVSFTVSDPDFAHRLRDFLFLPQRLNVAATRPRSKLILIASPALLDFAREAPVDDEGPATFAALLAAARRIDWGATPAPAG